MSRRKIKQDEDEYENVGSIGAMGSISGIFDNLKENKHIKPKIIYGFVRPKAKKAEPKPAICANEFNGLDPTTTFED